HVGRSARPDSADGRGGEQCDDGFRNIRRVRDDTIAWFDSETLERRSKCADLRGQCEPGEFNAWSRFGMGDNGGDVTRLWLLRVSERVLGVVQRCALEPFSARHDGTVEHAVVRTMRDDATKFP